MSHHKTHHGPIFRNHRGEHGARVTVEAEHSGWHGTYHFATHGKDREQIAEMHAAVVARHERKANKLGELAALIGQEIGSHVITDATVRDRAHGHELLCRARTAAGVRLEWRQYFNDPDVIPSAEDVLRGMRERIATSHQEEAKHASHLNEVRAALGLA